MKLTPRLVALTDSNLLFSWANDLAMRSMAIHSTYINYAEHFRWLKHHYNNPNCFIYIVEFEGRPIGQVRFDLYNIFDAHIDIYISPHFRGLGLACAIFDCCAKNITITHPLLRFNSTVLLGNLASSRLFERLNFKFTGVRICNQKWALLFEGFASC